MFSKLINGRIFVTKHAFGFQSVNEELSDKDELFLPLSPTISHVLFLHVAIRIVVIYS